MRKFLLDLSFRRPGDTTATFDLITTPSRLQQQALDLLAAIAL